MRGSTLQWAMMRALCHDPDQKQQAARTSVNLIFWFSTVCGNAGLA
jgi:hypothetical protein